LSVHCEDSREFLVTDAAFGNAHVDFDTTHSRLVVLDWEALPMRLFAGFIGRCPDGRVTTIGRDGGDYTGSIMAAALNADVLELWTDVDGVMTADVRQVPDSEPLPS
jgi:bifunctional aspartokinase / homoserine dehydrogenase 1